MSPVMDDEPERSIPDGAIETAIWCNRCMLPSGCRLPLEVKAAGSGVPIGNLTVVVCVDCGSRLDGDGNPIR